MKSFTITVVTSTSTTRYSAIAASTSNALDDAYAAQGDTLCGITVVPTGRAA